MFSYLFKPHFFLIITDRDCWYCPNGRKLDFIKMNVFVKNTGLSKDSSALNCNDLKTSAFCHVRRLLD